jgi:hypothetical protein
MTRMRTAGGLVLAFGLACTGSTEVAPPEPIGVAPAPAPPEAGRDEAAGRREGKAPGRQGRARGGAPPDPYVAEGACPGECCEYDRVVASGEAPLLAAPNGRKVGTIAKDEAMEARTGEVHVHPVVATVKHAHTLESRDGDETVAPGDRIWVLDLGGEGWGHVWHDGGVFSAEVLFALDDGCADGEPAQMCWAVAARRPAEQVWWVKVAREDGTEGWVDNTKDVLRGFDGCG